MYKLKGLDDILKKLDKLPEQLSRKIVKEGLSQAIEPVRAEAERNAPQGKHGSLKNLIIKANKVRDGYVSVNVRSGDQNVWWASFVEYGTKKQPPQGYMRRAFDSKGQQALDAAIEEIEKAIMKELGAS